MRGVRVAVGMSGGVDSTVSAWLLKKRGFDVVGVYMVNWDPQEEGSSQCSRTKDEADARKACDRLEIPFHTVNFVKEYWNEVFLGLLDNYKKGRTVVPDIKCNQAIKFNHLHKHAIEKLDVDFVATGHYSSTSYGDFQENRDVSKKVRLLTAADPIKDQTYFLCTLNQDQLSRAVFPVGGLMKTAVRQIALDQGFTEVAKKPESMGICFVGKRKNFDNFIDQYIQERVGRIVTTDGRVVGEHSGIHHFTLGKRVRIQAGSHLGYFVCRFDLQKNDVIVCESSHHPSLYAKEFLIREPTWIADVPDASDRSVTCRIQRTHPPVSCSISRVSDEILAVRPRLPLRAVADGQMCVFYKENECLGGGEVQEVTSTL